jgi:hypothetical protein
MDYPFYLRPFFQLPPDFLADVRAQLTEARRISHPHFTSKERNRAAFQLDKSITTPISNSIAAKLAANTPILQGAEIYWHEFNTLAAGGLLGEHSDLAHAGYNKDQGTPMEILLTHKIHVHIEGESRLSFRRSNKEPWVDFYPTPGACYWYNNYVWHKSANVGATERVALSLIYHDRRWIIRGKLFEQMGLKYNDCYQVD